MGDPHRSDPSAETSGGRSDARGYRGGVDPATHHVQAAEALARGDPLSALNLVAGDEGAHARALRGIAFAQLQEFDAATAELRAAAQAFAGEPLYRARALAALAEIAAARRELGTALEALAAAADELDAVGDDRNAAWARLVRARILLLVGSVDEARADLARAAGGATLDRPVLRAAFELARAAASVRELSAEEALAALDRALAELAREEHPMLAAELDLHRAGLALPLARLAVGERTVELALPALAAVFRGGGRLPIEVVADAGAGDGPGRERGAERERTSDAGCRRWLVVDAIARRAAFCGEDAVDLSGREVPFALLVELARAWPGELSSDELVARVFDGPAGDESHRERCRVEIGRLRRLLPGGARIEARRHAWRLAVGAGAAVVRVELLTGDSALTALLADGQAWAARDLSLAIGASPRSVQRALVELSRKGGARPLGEARARRWVASGATQGIASQMFLVSLLRPK